MNSRRNRDSKRVHYGKGSMAAEYGRRCRPFQFFRNQGGIPEYLGQDLRRFDRLKNLQHHRQYAVHSYFALGRRDLFGQRQHQRVVRLQYELVKCHPLRPARRSRQRNFSLGGSGKRQQRQSHLVPARTDTIIHTEIHLDIRLFQRHYLHL